MRPGAPHHREGPWVTTSPHRLVTLFFLALLSVWSCEARKAPTPPPYSLYYNVSGKYTEKAVFWKNCRPDNYAKIYPFFREQWSLAREELEMIYDLDGGVHNGTVARRYEHYLHRFYQFADGAVLFVHGPKNFPIIYYKILKCANEAIRGNLFRHMMLPDGSGPLLGPEAWFNSPQNLKSLKELAEIKKTIKAKGHAEDIQSFTFVRDPMSHFASGLTECTARSYKKPTTIQPDRIVGYLLAVLDFKRPLKQIEHFFPMAGTFFTTGVPNFIGQLETFQKDWQTVKMLFKLPESAEFDMDFDKKKTTGGKDPQNTRAAFKGLEPKYVRAICRILMADYICLPFYEMPPECKDLEAERKRGMDWLLSDRPAGPVVWFKSDNFG